MAFVDQRQIIFLSLVRVPLERTALFSSILIVRREKNGQDLEGEKARRRGARLILIDIE